MIAATRFHFLPVIDVTSNFGTCSHRSHLNRPLVSFAPHHLCAMSSHQPPSEGSDTSFWASVYTHKRPNILCGVITDINLHRFTLHQHLTTHRALTETPLLHPPFQQALPDTLQTHIQLYNTSIHQIEIHLRRALTALEALGRRPPVSTTPAELLPGHAIHLPQITRHNLVGTPPSARVLQHNSVQTTPTHFNNPDRHHPRDSASP